MMNFLKDWIIQYQNKFSVGGVETTIDRITGTVSQEGDTISAAYLNEIQKNCIYQVNATRVIEGVLEIYDVTIDGSEEFAPFNQTFLIDFDVTNTQVDSLLRFNGITYSLRFINYNVDIAPAIGGIPKQALVILNALNSKAYIQSVPLEEKQIIGKIEYIPFSIVPSGYLKANGAAVSRITYARLFAKIGTTFGAGDGSTTFNLPDLRGYFLRGWDDGRGIDSGRVLGSYQADELKAHKHLENSLHITGYNGKTYSVINGSEPRGPEFDYRISATGGTYTATSPYTENYGGIETRPRNIALMAIIKY